MRRTLLKGWGHLLVAVTLLVSGGGAAAAQDPEAGHDEAFYRTYSRHTIERVATDRPEDEVVDELRVARRNAELCESGDAAACRKLGEAYETGLGAPQVRPVAAVLYGEACAGGDAEGCRRAGLLNLTVDHDYLADDEYFEAYHDAAAQFERSCALGSSQGCVELSNVVETGFGVEKDPERAEAVLTSACGTLGGPSCRELALMLLQRQSKPGYWAEAVRLLETECRASDPVACRRLLDLYEAEERPAPLPNKAEMTYLGCNAGDAETCKDLGDLAMTGDGIVPDAAYAQTAYDRACALADYLCEVARIMRETPSLDAACVRGDAEACARMGEISDASNTVYSNPAVAGDYYASACDGGAVRVCSEAGYSALYGQDGATPERIRDAERYFDTACSAGQVMACDTLADMLYNGGAFGQDRDRALAYYAIVCASDWDKECELLGQVAMEDPSAPLPVAGSNFIPPDDPETGESSAAKWYAAMRAEEPDACTTNTALFRGREYSDTLCEVNPRVIGGRALRPGEAPWQALVWRPERLRGVRGPLSPQGRVRCGGSVIARGWVLTAAHCMTDYGSSILGRGYTIRLGVHNPRNDEGVTYPIIDGFVHENYNPRDFSYDIALIRYDPDRYEKASATNSIGSIEPDTLSVARRPITEGMEVYVYGWGWTRARGGTSTAELRSARLELASLERCTAISKYRNVPGRPPKLNTALCAGSSTNASSCKGDSGGPLIYYGDGKPVVVGVVSSGVQCGQTGEEGLYTRVGRFYPWIERTMRANR